MEKLYYDRENKKFYVKELDSVNNVVTDEQYVDVTDEMVELFQEYIAKDGRQVLCFDTTMLQLPDTVYKEGKKLDYSGYPSVGKTREEVKSENNVDINYFEKEKGQYEYVPNQTFTVEEIENFVHGHIQQKIDNDELHLTGIGHDNFEREFMIYRNALFEGIVNGISMCNNKIEGIKDK